MRLGLSFASMESRCPYGDAIAFHESMNADAIRRAARDQFHSSSSRTDRLCWTQFPKTPQTKTLYARHLYADKKHLFFSDHDNHLYRCSFPSEPNALRHKSILHLSAYLGSSVPRM
jgi:hypothetical protein